MKISRIILLVTFIFVSVLQVYSTLPPDPGQTGPGPGVPVPLDGGLLIALVAGGSIAALFLKKDKKKDK